MPDVTPPPDCTFVQLHARCGKPAFFYTEFPAGALVSRIVRKLDGSRMEAASEVVCGTCSEKMHPLLANVMPVLPSTFPEFGVMTSTQLADLRHSLLAGREPDREQRVAEIKRLIKIRTEAPR